MPTTAEVDQYRAAQSGLVTLATRSLAGVWAGLNISNAIQTRDALLEAVPLITTSLGESAAVLAADWYDEQRSAEAIAGRFGAIVADPVPEEWVQARVRYGVQHLFGGDPGSTLAFLTGAISEYVLQPGRDTITQSAAADPRARGWERRTRPDACGFCRLLSGRGGVYTKASVKFSSHGGSCRCVAVPSWDQDAPEVPLSAYVGSERMDALRERAARGDQFAARQLEQHRARVREAIAQLT